MFLDAFIKKEREKLQKLCVRDSSKKNRPFIVALDHSKIFYLFQIQINFLLTLSVY